MSERARLAREAALICVVALQRSGFRVNGGEEELVRGLTELFLPAVTPLAGCARGGEKHIGGKGEGGADTKEAR